VNFYRSQLGKKIVMAVTGIVLFGFILGHMLGNLKLYLGPHALNGYAEGLRDLGEPFTPRTFLLWVARSVLLVSVVMHITSATQLTLINRKARPEDYTKRDWIAANYASRTMRWGGVIILLFVIYHLMHFTFGAVHPDFVRGDVYHNVVTGFRVPWVSGFYMVAQLALGMHLYHGLWSLFQSLGWNHPRFNPLRRVFAQTFAVVVTVGNVSFPIAVLTRLVK
jgi:succinate dehydrogenase / fumarate reductase cytochrome b subunit